MAECRTCEFEAPRLIGELGECDACWKYRKRTGRQRPQRLHAKSGDRRSIALDRAQELEYLRVNGWRDTQANTAPAEAVEMAEFPDGTTREIRR